MTRIVVLTGRTCNGKTRLAKLLNVEFDFYVFDTSDEIKKAAKEAGKKCDRLSLQKIGDQLDKKTKHKWVFDAVRKASKKNKLIVVDNVRNAEQLEYFRQYGKWDLIHVHLYASNETLKERFKKRRKNNEKAKDHKEADLIKNEEDIASFKADADVRIYTERADAQDTFVRVCAHLGLYAPPYIRCVDVLVGGQFGSEGKGHVAAYLAKEYDVLVRVGGPNAGHTVSGVKGVYTYHQLPSGCADTTAEVLIGPGATLYVSSLLKEIKDCGLQKGRLFIDPQAMIISDDDKKNERDLQEGISSTGSGTGYAAARRIMDRLPGRTKLARDIAELSPFIGSTFYRLERAYQGGKSILLEGTQGSGLSLYHGQYPYVTSRDTNVAGCLAEAGISPSRVRRVLMVIRPTPIRVDNPTQGTSGDLKHETTFDFVASEAKLNQEDVKKAEKTSTTGRKRRVGWFDWELFRKSCALNAPTDLILTFADYLNAENQQAHRFEQLSIDTIKFIEELESVSQAPVSLINTRFPRTESERLDLRSIIDRRKWWAGNSLVLS
jgi:adenylosuccinate synthase